MEEVFVDPVSVEGVEEDEFSLSLFEGDEGGLRLEQRQCLVLLIKNHVVTRERHPKEWATLVTDTRVMKARLNDLFLDLEFDRERGVAYKVQVRSEVPGRFPPLLRDAAYTREETVLLVFLRQRFMTERSGGMERVRVDRQECLDAVARYRPAHATDVTGDLNKAKNAVESLRSAGVLGKTSDEERLEVSPVIEALLPLPQLRALVEWLVQENSPEGLGETDHDEDQVDEELEREDVA
ncbi:DUF4194 domain-containing protein [Propionibacteriaceae bacterium Y1685]|uniref:DUF4194 domain-containing protein n=1 Tax=Microlunatus sp. Y1700 TaxID=3418487 RepID=UPI003B82A1EF